MVYKTYYSNSYEYEFEFDHTYEYEYRRGGDCTPLNATWHAPEHEFHVDVMGRYSHLPLVHATEPCPTAIVGSSSSAPVRSYITQVDDGFSSIKASVHVVDIWHPEVAFHSYETHVVSEVHKSSHAQRSEALEHGAAFVLHISLRSGHPPFSPRKVKRLGCTLTTPFPGTAHAA